MQSGAIVPSDSAYASDIVLVRKKTGALRMCCDFRALNAKTVKDSYPLPRIDESMDALAGARYFSTLDLQSAYMQVPMHPDDAHKTAFTTLFGLYEHRRMVFELCNAPATFQRLMQTAFRNEMFNILLCYLDDLLVFSRTISEHIRRLDTVFTRLSEFGLKLELIKCYVPHFTAVASQLNALVTTCCREIKGKPRSSASYRLGSQWTENCEAVKLPLQNEVLKHAEVADVRLQTTSKSADFLFFLNTFSVLIPAGSSLLEEFCLYQCADVSDCMDARMDHTWNKIGRRVDAEGVVPFRDVADVRIVRIPSITSATQ